MVKLLSHYNKAKVISILEAERILGEEMKIKVSEEYLRRLKKL